MNGVYRREAYFAHGRLDQILRENFISGGIGQNPVAGQNRGIGGNDYDIAFAVNWFHAFAADIERIGVGINEIWEVDRVPARTHGIACIIEEAGSTCLRQTADEHVRNCWTFIVAVQQVREVRHNGIHHLQNAR